MLLFRLHAPRLAGFRGLPWMLCARQYAILSQLQLHTLGDGRVISLTLRSEDGDLIVMASTHNGTVPASGLAVRGNGEVLATSETFDLNYLWPRNVMQPQNTIEVVVTDANQRQHVARAIVPRP